ncbi:MFS transporter [Planomonospora parontospora]|nr:MFS transporter [Planomonospora parontospora]
MGTSFGLLAITIPGLAANHGSIATSGFITAAISAGGVIGGLAYGALNLRSTLWRRQAILSLIFGLPIVALLFTRSPWAVAAILLVSGLAVTPLYINSYLLIDEGIPSEVKHEANSWVGVGNDLGYTIGISVGGLLIAQHGVSSPLIGAGLIGAVLTIIALRGLTLKPAKTKSDTESQVVV